MADVSLNRINPTFRVEPHKDQHENKEKKKDQEEQKQDQKQEDTFVESKKEEKKEKKFMGHTMDWVSLNQSLKGEFKESA